MCLFGLKLLVIYSFLLFFPAICFRKPLLLSQETVSVSGFTKSDNDNAAYSYLGRIKGHMHAGVLTTKGN